MPSASNLKPPVADHAFCLPACSLLRPSERAHRSEAGGSATTTYTRHLNGKAEKEAQDLRRSLFPTPFSFFLGSTFEGAPREQQALLELEDTAMRLKREKETLRNTLNYLNAASAVKDVFPSSSSSS